VTPGAPITRSLGFFCLWLIVAGAGAGIVDRPGF
jgi:hypothetical protein